MVVSTVAEAQEEEEEEAQEEEEEEQEEEEQEEEEGGNQLSSSGPELTGDPAGHEKEALRAAAGSPLNTVEW